MRSKLNTKIRELFDEKRAVSPVIGVILMVAIVVILAAVIGFFVLGIGGEQSASKSASFTFNGDVSLTHDGGDTFQVANIQVLADGGTQAGSWSVKPISAGSVFTYATTDVPASGEEIRVVWTNPDNGQSTTLASFTVP